MAFPSTSLLARLDDNIQLIHSGGQVAVVRLLCLPHRLLCPFANVSICIFGVSEVGSDTAVQSDNKIQRHSFVIKCTRLPYIVSKIPHPDTPPVTA
jgi:hypothetical protein